MDALYKVVELKTDPEIYSPMTMPLKVDAAAEHDRVAGDFLTAAIGEVQYRGFTFVHILGTVNSHDTRDGRLNSSTLVFQVVPDNAVRFGFFGAKIHHF